MRGFADKGLTTIQANAFANNWGQIIFQSANEMNQKRVLKERISELQSQLDSEKEWWEKRRADISSSFMRELEEESGEVPAHLQKSIDDDAVLVDLPVGGKKKKKAKK